MKILIGDNDNIDFDAPIPLNIERQRKFIAFMKTLFNVVQEEPLQHARTERIGDKLFMRDWSPEEYAILLKIEDTNSVAALLGRTWMSVDIKRGGFIPEFLADAQQKGIDLANCDIRAVIAQFMKEKADELLKKRKKRSETRQKLKSLQEEKEEIEASLKLWDSQEKRNELELLKKIGKLNENIDVVIKRKKDEIKKELNDVEKEYSAYSQKNT